MDTNMDSENPPLPLEVPSHVFEIGFHPNPAEVLFTTTHVSSEVYVWRRDPADGTIKKWSCWKHHRKSCRTGKFFVNGDRFVSGSADGTCVVVDIAGTPLWTSGQRGDTSDPVNVVRPLDDHVFASGDDEGHIKVWDIRASPTKPCVSFQDYNEVVFSIEHDRLSHSTHLLATCGDCLSVYDMRQPKPHLEAMSDPQEADLLCCTTIRGGKKVLCGTAGNGAISIFNWGDFGDMNDRIMLHGVSLDHMLPLVTDSAGRQDLLVTGAGDGMIRVMSTFPHQIIGCVGTHNEDAEPIEALALSSDHRFLVSASHDNLLKFHGLPSHEQLYRILSEKDHPDAATRLLINPQETFFSDL